MTVIGNIYGKYSPLFTTLQTWYFHPHLYYLLLILLDNKRINDFFFKLYTFIYVKCQINFSMGPSKSRYIRHIKTVETSIRKLEV